MGYQSMKSGPMMLAPTLRAAMLQRRGLGDLTTTITDALPDAYSDTSTITGLPLVWEVGLGAIALLVLAKWGAKTGRTVRRRIKRAF